MENGQNLAHLILHVPRVKELERYWSFFLRTNLQCGHSNQVTWKKIAQSQHFLKWVIFKFFANRPITLINFKGFESFQQLCCWALNVIGQFTKKYLRVFLFPENIVMGQSSSKVSQFECPHCNIVVIKSQNWSTGLVWFLVSFSRNPLLQYDNFYCTNTKL